VRAQGDGVSDDTAAFVAAIASVDSGAILIPAGRYVISQQITISKSNIVLRGEGQVRTGRGLSQT
jgi:polygalacturonase